MLKKEGGLGTYGIVLYKPPSEEQTTYEVLTLNDDKVCTLKPLAFFCWHLFCSYFPEREDEFNMGEGIAGGTE